MLLLDANILIRAMLGSRVHSLLLKYRSTVEFFAKDSAFLEVHRHLPEVVEQRGLPVAPAMHMLGSLGGLVQEVELRTYAPFEDAARQRIERRDGMTGRWSRPR